jgi:glutamine amidotransferase
LNAGSYRALVISHIRRATDGPVSLANTQPLVRERRERMHCSAHNGRLSEIEAFPVGNLRHFCRVDETDSAVAFSAFSSGLWSLWHDGEKPTLDDRLAVIARRDRSARLASTPRTRISRC